jgi:hypothetical protein
MPQIIVMFRATIVCYINKEVVEEKKDVSDEDELARSKMELQAVHVAPLSIVFDQPEPAFDSGSLAVLRLIMANQRRPFGFSATPTAGNVVDVRTDDQTGAAVETDLGVEPVRKNEKLV